MAIEKTMTNEFKLEIVSNGDVSVKIDGNGIEIAAIIAAVIHKNKHLRGILYNAVKAAAQHEKKVTQ